MNYARYFAVVVIAAMLLYIGGYFISVQRFDGWCGSSPINDPTWSVIVNATPIYRFLNPSFWSLAHKLDLRIRPSYWTFTLHGSSQTVKLDLDSIGKPVFDTKDDRPWWKRYFLGPCD